MIDIEWNKESCALPKSIIKRIDKCLKGEHEPTNVDWNDKGCVRVYDNSMEQRDRLIDNLTHIKEIEFVDNYKLGTIDIYKARV